MIRSLLIKVSKFLNNAIDKITNKDKDPWEKYYINNSINYPDLTIYQLIEKTAMKYPFNYAYEYYGKKVRERNGSYEIYENAGNRK